MRVDAQVSDAIARLNARLQQSTGKKADLLSELFVGESLLPTDDGCSTGILPLGVAQTTQRCEWNIHRYVTPGLRDYPPSTTRMCPVTKSDASEARKIAALLRSWDPPKRPSGIESRSFS
jgi:hypothetical protein